MGANGLPAALETELIGLKRLASGYSGHNAREFSELNKRLRELIKQATDSRDEVLSET